MYDVLTPDPKPPVRPIQRPADAESSFALLARAREGDADALNDLCTKYLPRLQRWAHGRLPSWARGALDTHDLVQDTLTQVLQRLNKFEPRHPGAFPAYLRQALLNRIRDEIRRAQRRGPSDPPDTAKSGTMLAARAGHRPGGAERREPHFNAQGTIAAIIVRIELGHSYAEVAEELGKPSIAAAHMAVSRALVRLAQEMSRVRT